MMALHSRRDPALEVRITDQSGRTVVRTRHTGQEDLRRQATGRAAARTGGVLTREGQVAAGQDVLTQTENTPWDQRNVNRILSSPRSARGLSSVDSDIDLQTGRVIDGPNTRAAQARRDARQASSAAAPGRGGPRAIRPNGGFTNVAGNAATTMIRGLVPGVIEAETALVGGAMLASGHAATVSLVTPLLTAAEAVPIVGGSLVAGGVVGNLAEEGARSLGASESVSEASGAIAAGLTGAGVGALIGAPTGIGAPIGAAIGFVAGVGGYYLSRWLR